MAASLLLTAACLSLLSGGCEGSTGGVAPSPDESGGPSESPTETNHASASGSASGSETGSAGAGARAESTTGSPSEPSASHVDEGVAEAHGCGPGEVYVPETPADGFIMGARHSGRMDEPHRVVLTRPFCMDATEVTVRAYRECVEAGRCETPRLWGEWATYPNQPDHPVNKVNWLHAKAYCEFRGKTLPTEAQWEWAATGGDGRRWPWGDEVPDCTRADFTEGVLPTPAPNAGCHGGGPSAVGTHVAGDRLLPSGAIHDLAGNVWEWCLDNYLPYPAEPETDPVHLQAERAAHVVRGGGWNRSARGILSSYRGGATYDYQVPGLGFRCVRNLDGRAAASGT